MNLFRLPTVPPIHLDRKTKPLYERKAKKIKGWIEQRADKIKVNDRGVIVDGERLQIRDMDKEIQTFDADASWRELTWRERARYDLLVHARRLLQRRIAERASRRTKK